jgi:hypothetical protein
MGYFSEAQVKIVDAFEEGWTPSEVARMLKVDFADVNYVIENYLSENYDDSMDGDFDSGMASAGYGTDEDYGSY